MTESTPNLQQNFNAPVTAPNSQFGCTINQVKSLDQLFLEAVGEVRSYIQTHYQQELSKRQSLLGILTVIENHFNNNNPVLRALIEQASCKKTHTEPVTYSFLVYLTHFFTSAYFHCQSTLLPDNSTLATSVNTNKCWAFSSAASTALGLEHHLGAIADYITSNPDNNIRDGNCFIFKLLTKSCNCQNGKLTNSTGMEAGMEAGIESIVLDFFTDKKIQKTESVENFLEIVMKCNLTFKCGECLCNVTRLEDSRSVL